MSTIKGTPMIEDDFKEYLKQARIDFDKALANYPIEHHLKLRTEIDTFLIAYDQAVDKALAYGRLVDKIQSPYRDDVEKYYNYDN
jgi:hypothetical protein